MRRIGLAIALVTLIGTDCTLQARAAEPASEQVRFFETRIRPLLADNCFRCHGPKRQRGDLRLDSREAMLRGGASGGSALVPGRPEKSLLITAVRYQKKGLKMPPKGKLKDRQIADLTRWITMGAVFPGSTKVATGSKHWAFTPPVDPPIPAVKNKSWAKTPLDHFILAKLEEKRLQPAPAADRRTLIRRATFDLIGLPPTPEEVEAFVHDKSPNAFAKVVERLLASPHYGERWARHWLDVARYADSNGLDENVAFGNAWRYRDYVVAAFNKDKPYNQFILEQIAGDLLPAQDEATRREQLIATGFLALGPKVLAEVDEKKMEMDILDEQIDTLGRAFMALTLGCARCHNHKFDPITMEDYYGLVGIFQSTKTMETFKKVAKWHENSLATTEDLQRKAAHEKKIAGKKAEIQKLVSAANQQLKAQGKKLPKKAETLYPPKIKEQLKRLRAELKQLEKTRPEMPMAMGVTEGKVANAVLMKRGNHLTPGQVVIRHFPDALVSSKQISLGRAHSGRLELAQWLTNKDHPLTSRVMVNRLWRWHFGEGIVGSTDNFGRLGKKPSNQALLDWLSHRFMENGWSIKQMHRLIMLSGTYQMSSRLPDGKNSPQSVDPGNRLHWRANVRRLEAEAIRDGVLAVSGLLDKKMGGSLLHVKNRAYFFDHTSKDLTNYDSHRRTLYLPVVRNNLYDVFQLFDATDATVGSSDRATTTVATQALFMMNSNLVAQAADKLAKTLLAQKHLDDAGRVRLLYLKAYGRLPTASESARAARALSRFEQVLRSHEANTEVRRQRAWGLLCHVIISANEFVYVN